MTGNKSDAGLKRTLRARMIKEDPEELRPSDDQIKLKKKLTPYDRMQIVREKNAERQRTKRAQMSEKDKERQRALDAKQARRRIAQKAEGQTKLIARNDELKRQNKLSQESRSQELRNKDAELKRKKCAEMTEEEKNEHRARWAEIQRKKRSTLSEEERKQNRAKWAEEKRRKRALLSKEEKKKINAKKTQDLKVKENETTDQRLRRLILQIGAHITKNSDRYQIAGTFIKNAFCGLREIHSEVELLKNNFKLYVARAVRYAVKSHLKRKRRHIVYKSLYLVN